MGYMDRLRDAICKEPTPAPTVDPSIIPTSDPTFEPTKEPTKRPTRPPSRRPTESPVHKHCYMGFDLDFIFIADDSCGYTEEECDGIMTAVAEYQQLIKGNMSPRFGMVRMTADNAAKLEISLDDATYNDINLAPDNSSEWMDTRKKLYKQVSTMTCNSRLGMG